MGGLYGHIDHVYENRQLTFAELKDILKKANAGDLHDPVEKTDGFNLFFSFRDGEAVCARSKKDIQRGGLTYSELVKRDFRDQDIKRTFLEAFQAFESAAYNLDDYELEKVFGKYGDIYYSVEIISPDSHNIINYDDKIICIHRRGHALFDRKSGERVKNVDVSENSNFLDDIIDKLNQNDKIDDNEDAEEPQYQIVRGQKVTMSPSENDEALQNALRQIQLQQKRYDLNDDNTIRDYLVKRLRSFIKNDEIIGQASKDVLDYVVGVVIGEYSLRSIPSSIPDNLKNHIRKYGRSKKGAKKLLKKAIWPIEDAIHDYTVEILNDVHSMFLDDPEAETERVRKHFKQACEAIKNYQGKGQQKAKDILKRNYDKIKSIDNIDCSIEGIIFDYNNHTYKFTGNFAPINQILNVYKYGRGEIPALQNLQKAKSKVNLDEGINYMPINYRHTADEPVQQDKMVIGLVPGSFKPPHIGHWSVVQKLLTMKNSDGEYIVEKVRVLISPKDRVAHGERSVVVTADKAKQIWDVFIKDETRVIAQVVEQESPIRATFDFLADEMPEGGTLVVAKGTKDHSDQRFKNLRSFSQENNLGVDIEPISVSGPDVSSTQMRQFIADYKEYDFKQLLPDHLTEEDREKCWEIVHRQPVKENKKVFEKMLLPIWTG